MKTFPEEWESRIQSATEVPFSVELHERILHTAQQLAPVTARRPVRRRGYVRSWMAAAGGLAAALVMAVTVWRAGVPVSTPSPQTTATDKTQHMTSMQMTRTANNPASNSANGTFNNALSGTMAASTLELPVASLQVTGLKKASSQPGGPKDEVVATLKNTGSSPVSKQDVYGVLSFSSSDSNSSNGTPPTWLTFVNGPDKPLAPGHTAPFTFQPITAPADVQHNLTEVPELTFYATGLKAGSQGATRWNTAAIQAPVSKPDVLQTWSSGESFQVPVQVRNTSSKPIVWSNLFAVIWFDDPAQPNQDFTAPDVPRFLTRVKGNSVAPKQLLPGQSVNLSFGLVGGATPNLPNLVGHVVFIDGVH